MDTPVFDASMSIAMNLRTQDGVKTIRVRFPSDEEWIERQRRRKVIVKDLGRGQSETTVINREDADAALLAKIRTEQDGPEVDPFEAAKLIEELATCEIDDVVPVGEGFRITTRVLGTTTTHLLKIPTAKDQFEYRRGFARAITLPFGRQELTVNIAPVGAMYKRLVVATEGYASANVPIVHQAVAVRAAMDALDMAFAEDRDANFPPASPTIQ
jgi:hypothetical protein